MDIGDRSGLADHSIYNLLRARARSKITNVQRTHEQTEAKALGQRENAGKEDLQSLGRPDAYTSLETQRASWNKALNGVAELQRAYALSLIAAAQKRSAASTVTPEPVAQPDTDIEIENITTAFSSSTITAPLAGTETETTTDSSASGTGSGSTDTTSSTGDTTTTSSGSGTSTAPGNGNGNGNSKK
jgi:hypothetical protein